MNFCEVCFGNKGDSDFSASRLAAAYLAVSTQALCPVAHNDHAIVVTAFGVLRNAAAIVLYSQFNLLAFQRYGNHDLISVRTVGRIVAQLLAGTVFELPTFVCVLFVGVIVSNGLALVGFYRVFERAVSVLGNVSLSLFLAMALMSLKLWELASLALPMLAILVVQSIFMALYAIFVTWRMMGKNYDAAVLAAGHCGFGLGATPTAIANMQAITERFGPSHMAFLVVPMVGAFFIDIVNALVIKLYLLLPIFAQ